MNIKLKMKLMQKDYEYIKAIIKFRPEDILKLNFKDQCMIVEYLIRNNEVTLLSILFGLNNISLKKIIYKTPKDSELLERLVTISLKDFVEYSIEENNIRLVDYIVSLIISNNINKAEYVSLIKEYLLSHEVDSIFVKIACIPEFRDPNLEDKIIKSSNYVLILNYILNCRKNSKFLKKYILSNIKEVDFICLLRELMADDHQSYINFKRLTLEAVREQKISSIYLFYIVKSDPYAKDPYIKDSEKYIKTIIMSNEHEVVRSLMAYLGPKSQEYYATKALQEKNEKAILNLASTTNCAKTKSLINYFFDNYQSYDTYVRIAILIGFLEGEFLNYAIEKAYKEKGQDYFMNIIGYLIDADNKAWVDMIDYIYDNDLALNFSVSNYRLLIEYRYKLEYRHKSLSEKGERTLHK